MELKVESFDELKEIFEKSDPYKLIRVDTKGLPKGNVLETLYVL